MRLQKIAVNIAKIHLLLCVTTIVTVSSLDLPMPFSAEGRVLVWGSGSEGQLGLGAETECPKPKWLLFDKRVVCIACGYYHSALVTGRSYSVEKLLVMSFKDTKKGLV